MIKKSVVAALFLFLAACATSYDMPEMERSRSYKAEPHEVWDAALACVDDVGFALVEAEEEHGRIRARTGWSIWDIKGHKLLVVVRETEEGRVRVDANAETVSDDQNVDFGKSKGMVRDFLRALDARMDAHNGY